MKTAEKQNITCDKKGKNDWIIRDNYVGIRGRRGGTQQPHEDWMFLPVADIEWHQRHTPRLRRDVVADGAWYYLLGAGGAWYPVVAED